LSTPRNPRPLRADAARNRDRVLEAARSLFASRGVEVPLDDIAARAGVGPGTVHRHFPTKQALLVAIVVERLDERVDQGVAMAEAEVPGGLFEFIGRLLDDGRDNRAIKAALTRSGYELRRGARRTTRRLDQTLSRLLAIAQRSGTAAEGLDLDDVKTLLVAALAAQEYAGGQPDQIARARQLALAGLAPGPTPA
jgi:AcrR family transcriptional regulator